MIQEQFTFGCTFYRFSYTVFTLSVDFSSRGGNDQGIGKDGIWCNGLWWCRPVCMQLRILPFLAFCRTEWHPITICTRAPLPNHRRGDTNAICCFFAGATRHFILVLHICDRKCICLVIYAVYAEESWFGYKCNALINSELLVNGKCIWCVHLSPSMEMFHASFFLFFWLSHNIEIGI